MMRPQVTQSIIDAHDAELMRLRAIADKQRCCINCGEPFENHAQFGDYCPRHTVSMERTTFE